MVYRLKVNRCAHSDLFVLEIDLYRFENPSFAVEHGCRLADGNNSQKTPHVEWQNKFSCTIGSIPPSLAQHLGVH